MTDPAWISLARHSTLGVTATVSDDDRDEAHSLLLDAGFCVGHPEFAYALDATQPHLVEHALERLYAEVGDHAVVIDDVDLGRLPPAATQVRERAVHPDRIEQLSAATAVGERALAEWDAVSDSLADADGWPFDERYDLRQHQRDAEMWAQFEPYLRQGPPLLAHAEAALARFAPDVQLAGRWPYRLRELRTALEGGAQVQGNLEFVSEILLRDHPAYEETWRRAVALRNAEGWHYALTWVEHAPALAEITQAERELATGSAPSRQPEAARSSSPLALRHINAAIESSSARPAAIQHFPGNKPPRSR
ncbi:hypothetical protein AB0J38_02450 [Streptomyces sp. NPDC050095]|uniref:hypothetical protein n=1 Tax=unclassified Streptomyces TaxID=2593676 RepID=UPI0034252F54